MPPATTFGKYQVQRILGRGGMGTVYEALDPHLNRKVALKTMMPGLLGDPGLRARFLREAQAAGALNHRNIVTVYDLGEDRGQPYIAMEFIEGTDLERVIVNREPYPVEWKASVIRQICDGLGHAHRAGIIHRDVKPANIRVTPLGEVKIMDFGIAHLQTPTRLTRGGQVLGTVHYMAPEQIEGGKVDHRADIFAVGAIAYELLTYKRPFDGESLTSVMFKIAHEDADRNAFPRTILSPRLEEIVLKALTRDISERYQNLAEMQADIEALMREAFPAPQEPVEPAQIARWVAEGEREIAGGDPAKALEFAKKALAAAPADAGAQALARKAEAEALKRRVERELASIRTEIERAREQGQLQKALSLAQRLLQLDPDDRSVAELTKTIQDSIKSVEVDQLCSTALSYAAEGDVDLALKIAAKIERIAPASTKYQELRKYLQEESARRAAEAFVATAREHLGMGNVAEALAAAEEALAAHPSHATAREIRERAIHVLAAQNRASLPVEPVKTAAEPAASLPPPIAPPRAPTPTPPTLIIKPSRTPTSDDVVKPVLPPLPVAPPAVPAAPAPADVAARPEAPAPPPATPTPAERPEPPPVARVSAPTPAPAVVRPATSRPPTPVFGEKETEALLSDLGITVTLPSARPAPKPTPAPAPPVRTPTPMPLPPPPTPAKPRAVAPPPAAPAPVSERTPATSSNAEEAPPPLTPLPEGVPANAEAARLLEQARRTLRDRQPQKALSSLEKAAALEPTHLGIQRLLVQTRIEARKTEIESLVTSALNHFVANDYKKAKKAVDKALALDPGNKKAKELMKILGALA
jgi:eukaryotic-like serine/threonine-protein kinase